MAVNKVALMLNRLTLAALAAVVAAPAFAGGFAQPVVVAAPAAPVAVAPAPAPVVVTNDWTGGYVGAQLGFGRLSTDIAFEGDRDVAEFEEEVFQGSGPLFGVHAGYMMDFGGLVAGVELDYDKTQIDLEPGDEFVDVFEGDIGQLDSIARGKLRLGFDAGRALPYLTAGLARATFDIDEAVTGVPLEDDTSDGRVFGLGVSFMASDTVMVGVEALRHNFEDAPNFQGFEEEGVAIDTVVDTISLRGSFRF